MDIERSFKGVAGSVGKALRQRRRGIMPALSEGMKSLPVGTSGFMFEEK
ncbi:hypothetical protein GV819_25095 [Pseudomonas sp. Fl5BN2]|nr:MULTISPECIES: hypothetical protein [unclassified Pseudomonas]NBF05576.1 hypothetical protein [Pseudomonas sp. Fl5BN2]NBF10605.1 hypothetical protein [Pseudomonas sp. Fl4BN1]